MEKRIATYEEFWPFYVTQHLNATCRNLHFVGSSSAIGFAVMAVLVSPKFLIASVVSGYFFAWIGHFFFEHNRPATFTYPAWSLRADFRMFRFMLFGRMASEVAKVSH